MSAAFSFLPAQFCVYLQTTMFFRRYLNQFWNANNLTSRFDTPLEKAKIVPGISELRKL